jgi:hypothetical protein
MIGGGAWLAGWFKIRVLVVSLHFPFSISLRYPLG